jgi:hypothetical protein
MTEGNQCGRCAPASGLRVGAEPAGQPASACAGCACVLAAGDLDTEPIYEVQTTSASAPQNCLPGVWGAHILHSSSGVMGLSVVAYLAHDLLSGFYARLEILR